MGLPSINIAFSTAASSAIQRSQKGVVGIIVKDTSGGGAYSLTKKSDIPAALSAANQAYVASAFLGYVSPPRKVLLYVLPASAEDLSEALVYFKTVAAEIDYLVGPPETADVEAVEIADWVAEMRADGYTPKAVLPNMAANSEAIINFTASGIKVGAVTYTAAQYCARIAGLIAGTPMTISCTYAPLPEVSDVARKTKQELDAAIDNGEFVLFHDGAKVKVGRGVNSLITVPAGKSDAFKKIKIVEALDMIQRDIRTTAEDSYIGKYANSYDNKCLLITAIKAYLTGLEAAGILAEGTSDVQIDLEAQENYLISQGIDTSAMTEQEIKTAATGDKVFLRATISVLDAIEDISLTITI